MEELQLKYVVALTNLSETIYNTTLVKPKNKHHFVRPIRRAGISLNEAKGLGFRIGKTVWKSCLDTNNRHLGG